MLHTRWLAQRVAVRAGEPGLRLCAKTHNQNFGIEPVWRGHLCCHPRGVNVQWHCWWHWELEATTGIVATADARSWMLLPPSLLLSVMMLQRLYLFLSSQFEIQDRAFDWLYLGHVLSPICKGDWETKYLAVSASMLGEGYTIHQDR